MFFFVFLVLVLKWEWEIRGFLWPSPTHLMNEWKKRWRQFTFSVPCFKETFDDCCQLQLTRLNDSLDIKVSFYPFQCSCYPFLTWLRLADDEAVGRGFLGPWQTCRARASLSLHHCLTEAWLECDEHQKHTHKNSPATLSSQACWETTSPFDFWSYIFFFLMSLSQWRHTT